MSDSFFPYRWTGDPWVDSSIRTLLALRSEEALVPQRRIRAPEEISLADLHLLMEQYPLDQINTLFNSYIMIFTNNNPLHNYAFKKNQPNTEEALNRRIYRSILKVCLEQLESDRLDGVYCCDVCGQKTKANFAEMYEQGFLQAGEKKPDSQGVDRAWFPLGGTLGSEAQAFPGSRCPLKVCLPCLFALQFLPLGVRLYRGKLLLAESNSHKLCQKIVAANVKDNLNRFHANNPESSGKGESPLKTLEFLLDKIETVTDLNEDNATTLCLWHMSNSTQEAACDRTEIPNRVLLFLAKAWSKYPDDLKLLFSSTSKDDLLLSVVDGRDIPLLYPSKQWPGVSEEFYGMYQRELLGFSQNELQVYKSVALLLRAFANEPEQKMLAKTDAAEKHFVAYQTAVRRILKHATTQGLWSTAFHVCVYATRLDAFPLQNNRYAKEVHKRIHFYYQKSLGENTAQTEPEPQQQPKARKAKKSQVVDVSSPEVQQHVSQARELLSTVSTVSWNNDAPGVAVLQGIVSLFCLRFDDKLADICNTWSHQKRGLCPLSTLHSLFCWPDLRNPLLAEHWYTWLWQQEQDRLHPWPLLELLTILLHQPDATMTTEQAEATLQSWCPGDVFVGESAIMTEQLKPIQTFCQIFLDRFVYRRGSLRSFEREQLREFRTKKRSLPYIVETWFPILESFAQEQSLDLPTTEEILGLSEDIIDVMERKKFFLLSLCSLYRERRRNEVSSVLQEDDDIVEYEVNDDSQDDPSPFDEPFDESSDELPTT